MTRPAVLFVCLGNICRSPLAEAAFRAEAERAGLDAIADSAGTAAYHVGEPPDPRAIATAAAAGIAIGHYRGRQLVPEDFSRFTHVLVMDRSNLANALRVMPEGSAVRPQLLLDWVPGREGAEVSDPYYDGEENFGYTWDDVTRAARCLVEELRR